MAETERIAREYDYVITLSNSEYSRLIDLLRMAITQYPADDAIALYQQIDKPKDRNDD